MEGRLGRCRGILGALFPTYYWFKLDEATLTLSYAANQENIHEPLMEIDLMFAKVQQKTTKIYIETCNGGSLTLKASSEAEAKQWTVTMEDTIKEKAELPRIPDGENMEEILAESREVENPSDALPETESKTARNLQMKPKPDRIKEIANQRFSTTTGVNIDRMVHEMKKVSTKQTVEKSVVSTSEGSTPERFAKIKQYVVAIDFGTTYSGYAYQHISNHKRNPAGGSTEMWQESNGMSEKTPTSLLLTKDGKFEAFGYEAEKRYFELVEDDKEESWKFFKQFKMRIFQKNGLNRQIEIKDDQGKSMPAAVVFGLSIEFLKQRAFENIKESDPGMMEENIFYVVTVPAIWGENSRQFMLDAIRMAGIDDDQAILAKEPEVAAVYCKEKQLEVHRENKRIANQDDIFKFEKGSKFVVLDLGGGTADVSVQQVIDNGRMKILRSASGGPWGGSKPNEEFMKIIGEITGRNSNEELLKEKREVYYELLQAWESKKRVSTGEGISDINLSLPAELTTIIKNEGIVTSRGSIRISKGKLRLTHDAFKSLFDETVKSIVDHLKQMEQKGAFDDINVMFMVGGFSKNKFIQEAVRDAFREMTIIVPESPIMAVLRGAVAYGFQPKTIDARVSSSHYGIEEDGSFIQLIDKGQEIPVGVIVSSYKTKLFSGTDGFRIKIFASDEDIPPKEIEQCSSIGEIFIRMYKAHGKIEKEIEIAIYFDHTEMKVQATDVLTNRVFKTSCNFLE